MNKMIEEVSKLKSEQYVLINMRKENIIGQINVYDNRRYFCQNTLNGSLSNTKLDYRYSYVLTQFEYEIKQITYLRQIRSVSELKGGMKIFVHSKEHHRDIHEYIVSIGYVGEKHNIILRGEKDNIVVKKADNTIEEADVLLNQDETILLESYEYDYREIENPVFIDSKDIITKMKWCRQYKILDGIVVSENDLPVPLFYEKVDSELDSISKIVSKAYMYSSIPSYSFLIIKPFIEKYKLYEIFNAIDKSELMTNNNTIELKTTNDINVYINDKRLGLSSDIYSSSTIEKDFEEIYNIIVDFLDNDKFPEFNIEKEIKEQITSSINSKQDSLLYSINEDKYYIEEEKKRIESIKEKMETKAKAIEIAKKELAIIEEEINSVDDKVIFTNPKVKYAFIDNDYLIFYTKPLSITVKNHTIVLGKFKVKYKISSRSVNIINLTRYVTGTSFGYHAPHVPESGNPCLGGYSNEIVELALANNYEGIIDILIGFIESVNEEDSAGKDWWMFEEDEDKKEELRMEVNSRVYCIECDHEMDEGDEYISPDDDAYCQDCYNDLFSYCHECECSTSRNLLHTAANGNFICEACYDESYSKCNSCNEIYEKDEMIEVDNDFHCKSCYEEKME